MWCGVVWCAGVVLCAGGVCYVAARLFWSFPNISCSVAFILAVTCARVRVRVRVRVRGSARVRVTVRVRVRAVRLGLRFG